MRYKFQQILCFKKLFLSPYCLHIGVGEVKRSITLRNDQFSTRASLLQDHLMETLAAAAAAHIGWFILWHTAPQTEVFFMHHESAKNKKNGT